MSNKEGTPKLTMVYDFKHKNKYKITKKQKYRKSVIVLIKQGLSKKQAEAYISANWDVIIEGKKPETETEKETKDEGN